MPLDEGFKGSGFRRFRLRFAVKDLEGRGFLVTCPEGPSTQIVGL